MLQLQAFRHASAVQEQLRPGTALLLGILSFCLLSQALAIGKLRCPLPGKPPWVATRYRILACKPERPSVAPHASSRFAGPTVLTEEQGAGPGYTGAPLGLQLAALPAGGSGGGSNTGGAPAVVQGDGSARGFLLVSEGGSLGAVCAREQDPGQLAAMVACRALGWSGGTARAVA